MKKQILLLCGAYCASVFCAVRFPAISTESLCLFLVFLLGFVFWRFRDKRLWSVVFAVFVLLGHAHASYRNQDANFVPTQFHTRVVDVEGVVREVRAGEGYRCYILEPDKLTAKRSDGIVTDSAAGKIAVTVYDIDEDRAAYAYGDRILACGTFSLHTQPENSGEFDYGMWYKTDGVYGSITAKERNTKLLGKAQMPVLESYVQNARAYCIESIRTYIGGQEGGLLSGIVLNWCQDIPQQLQENINSAGLSHICVASGMHVSMMYGVLLWIFTRLRLKKRIYYPICAVVLHIFAALCGGGASMQRAILMFDLCMLSFYTLGDEDRVYTCFWSGFLMLLVNPLYLFSVGFLLSFLCVFGILLFEKPIEDFLVSFLKWRPFCAVIAVSLSAQVLVLPLQATHFSCVPLYGLVYNILILWIIAPLMVLSAVFLILTIIWPYGAGGVAFVLKLILQGICAVVGCVRYLPAAKVGLALPSAVKVMAYYCIVGCIYFLWLREKRFSEGCLRAGLVCLLCITIANFADSHYLKLDFINVGEGDAALLRSPAGVTVLVDGGGSPAYSNTNVGEKTVLPYLNRLGVSKIDYAVVSHYERDHVQGVLYVCEHMSVRKLILPARHEKYANAYKAELEACAKKRGIEVCYMRAGDSMILEDGMVLEALSPNAQMLQKRLSENNLSLVLRVRYGDVKMLFSGDIEMLAEKQLYVSDADVEADIYKVAHHGADTSSAYPFVKRVQPKFSVISAGDYFASGHPSPQTVTTLKRMNTEIYNTYTSGNVTFYITKSGVRYVR